MRVGELEVWCEDCQEWEPMRDDSEELGEGGGFMRYVSSRCGFDENSLARTAISPETKEHLAALALWEKHMRPSTSAQGESEQEKE